MCFNFEAAFPEQAAKRLAGIKAKQDAEVKKVFKASVYPKKDAPVVASIDDKMKYFMANYSLIPHYMKLNDLKYSTYNARSEDVLEKRTFKKYFIESRCLIPMTAYYEYSGTRGADGRKIYRSNPKDESILMAAGILSTWTDTKGVAHPTFAIITTEPTKQVEKYYERMPVFLNDKYWDIWLDKEFNDVKALQEICVPWVESKMVVKEIKRKKKTAK